MGDKYYVHGMLEDRTVRLEGNQLWPDDCARELNRLSARVDELGRGLKNIKRQLLFENDLPLDDEAIKEINRLLNRSQPPEGGE